MNKNIKDNLTKAKQVMFGTKKAKLITFSAAALTALTTIAIPVAVVSTNGFGKAHRDIDEPTFLIKYPGSIVNHEIVANAFKDATLPADFALPSTITDIAKMHSVALRSHLASVYLLQLLILMQLLLRNQKFQMDTIENKMEKLSQH